jgi:hypothetical protein
MIKLKDLVGEWELEKFIITKNDGAKNTWGKDPNGILLYTATGYVSVSINSMINNSEATADEKLKNILFYSGKYKILDKNRIVHHVLNASDINRIGNDLFREATIQNNKLHLISEGAFGTATLSWKKIHFYKDQK